MIRKTLWCLSFAIAILFLHSCEIQPDVPLVVSAVVPTTTTTTTVKAPVMIVSQSPAATTTTTTLAPAPKPILPSISEPEYRNLFASVNNSYKDVLFYELDSLLPEAFVLSSTQFQSARVNFETQVWRWPYNGEAAYPFAQDLRIAGQSLDALLVKGLPMRSEVEKIKVQNLSDVAKASGLTQASPVRSAKAFEEFEQGRNSHTKALYRNSIAAFRKAKLLYASADAQVKAATLRQKLEQSGFSKYSPYDIAEADRLVAEDQSLFALGDNESTARGTELLIRAQHYYANAYTWGLECDAAEAHDKALLAKRRADSLAADKNASLAYEKASTSLGEGDKSREASDFSQASTAFRQAETDFDAAHRLASQRQCEAKAAQELAKRGIEHLRTAFATASIEPDLNFTEAELFYGLGDLALNDLDFALAKANYDEVLNQLALSQANLQELMAERQAQAQAEAERKAAEKAEAEQAATQVLDAKNAELETLRIEKAEAERKLAEALASQGMDARAEAERLAAERSALEKATIEAKAEADRLAAERAAAEQARSVAAQAAAEAKAASERLAAERAAAEQAARDKAAAEAAARERAASQAAAQAKAAADAEAALRANEAAARAAAAAAQEAARAAPPPTTPAPQAPQAAPPAEAIAQPAPFPAAYIVDLLPKRRNKDSLTFIAAQDYVYNDPLKWGILYEANKAQLKDPDNPDLLISGQVITIPSLRGEERSGVWDPAQSYGVFDKGFVSDAEKQAAEAALAAGMEAKAQSRQGAQSALGEAQKAYDKALARNAKNNYPADLASAAKTLEAAKASFKTGDFASASAQAQSAQETFAAIPELAPLPARYKVRYIPGETDTLWRIAGFPFIYNNNYLWMRLYNANKDLLHAANDPHLILPGQILTIPSLKGEVREGLWDAKKTYPIYK